jgi:two-component system phosphate regulon sensor histidine kinase PhoR
MTRRDERAGGMALLLWLPAAIGLGAAYFIGSLGFWASVASAALAYAAALAIARRHVDDLARIAETVEALAAARKVEPKIHDGPLGTREIGAALEGLGVELASRAAKVGERVRIADDVADALPDPLVLLARDRRILRANRAARELFGGDVAGGDIAEILRNSAVLRAIEGAMTENKPQQAEFSVAGKVNLEFRCRVSPIAGAEADSPAAVVLLENVTEAKQIERMRADFVANASHEIRTPLASVAGFLETLAGPAKDDAPARERFLGVMAEQVARIRRLVDDLLSLSRIEVREHMAPTAPVALERIVRAASDTLAFRARSTETDVTLALAPDLPPIAGDEGELEQVFQNLIDNAITYGAGKPVRIEARFAEPGEAIEGRPCALVSVVDQGPGIPREHLPRLTERFYRVDAARSRQAGGTGLGLAIVKHIVNRHRGQLLIQSEVGKGSRFSVILPIMSSNGNKSVM